MGRKHKEGTKRPFMGIPILDDNDAHVANATLTGEYWTLTTINGRYTLGQGETIHEALDNWERQSALGNVKQKF